MRSVENAGVWVSKLQIVVNRLITDGDLSDSAIGT